MVDILIRSRRSLALIGAVSFALGLGSCAHGDERRPPSTPPATETADEGDEERGRSAREPAPREISSDRAHAADPAAGSPERAASQRLVEEGKGYLIADQPDEAERRFLRAARIDPTNGFAWYHLGRARLAAGDRAGAIGVLEKAETLLGPYPDWRARASRLLVRAREG